MHSVILRILKHRNGKTFQQREINYFEKRHLKNAGNKKALLLSVN